MLLTSFTLMMIIKIKSKSLCKKKEGSSRICIANEIMRKHREEKEKLADFV